MKNKTDELSWQNHIAIALLVLMVGLILGSFYTALF